MGLSICRSIIENHGGRIWVSAGASRGTIFRLELPAIPSTNREVSVGSERLNDQISA
jgi:signal transduction histidine kinase